jgi:IclR family transcriptional regulator, acetate operon repressor
MSIPAQANDKPRVQSAARALSILSAVAASAHGLTAREIADAVGLKIATTYHLVHTLVGEGFLVSSGERRYRLGFRVGTLVDGFERQVVPADLVPFAHALASVTGETAYVSVRRQTELATVSSVHGANAVSVRRSPLGPIDNAHARASGKLLLALAPTEVLEQYLAVHPMTACTPRTMVDRTAFDADLEATRRRGYAVDHEEYLPGVSCLSVPLAQEPLVALSLSAPTSRFDESFTSYLDAALQVARGPLVIRDDVHGE